MLGTSESDGRTDLQTVPEEEGTIVVVRVKDKPCGSVTLILAVTAILTPTGMRTHCHERSASTAQPTERIANARILGTIRILLGGSQPLPNVLE